MGSVCFGLVHFEYDCNIFGSSLSVYKKTTGKKNILSLSVLQSQDEVSDWVSTAVAANRATTTLTYLLWIQVRV